MKREDVVALNGNYVGCSVDLENNEHFVSVDLVTNNTGFHEIEFEYQHTDWDQWVKVEILHSDGTMTEYMPTLPAKINNTSALMYLKSGKNTFTIRHKFGHKLTIKNIKIANSAPKIKPEAIPSHDWYYKDAPCDIKIEVVHYNNTVISVFNIDCEIDFSVESCDFEGGDPYYNGYKFIRSYVVLKNETLAKFGLGVHNIKINLSDGSHLDFTLNVNATMEEYPLNIISLDVNHANSSLIKLPNGKTLLVDSGGNNVVFNYLKNNNIKPDYYLLTHFHNDHYAHKDDILEFAGIKCPDSNIENSYIAKPFHERAEYLSNFGYIDSKMLCIYDKLHEIWDLGGVEITALNSRFEKDGSESSVWNDPDIEFNEHNYENATSISFLLRYNGFGYYHGADNYAYTQRLNFEDFKNSGSLDQLKCEYFYANHHFHCDLDLEFLKFVNPVAVYIPANQAVYSRSTYNYDYLKGFVEVDFSGKRLQDTFISHANGSVQVLVKNKDDWRYSSF